MVILKQTLGWKLRTTPGDIIQHNVTLIMLQIHGVLNQDQEYSIYDSGHNDICK